MKPLVVLFCISNRFEIRVSGRLQTHWFLAPVSRTGIDRMDWIAHGSVVSQIREKALKGKTWRLESVAVVQPQGA
jgi:hypothetical protein